MRRAAPAPNRPKTRLEWQEAVNAAHWLLEVAAMNAVARHFNLVLGGPRPNVARCQRLLEDGAHQGIVPCDRYCRVCGCTDEDPCDEGCEWVEQDLCSACVPAE